MPISKRKTQSYSVIAIDGPGAVGKTTVGKALANRLGFLFVDTGVMYRAVTISAISRGIDIHNEYEVTSLAQSLEIQLGMVDSTSKVSDGTVLVNGEDISNDLKTPGVDKHVSIISKHPGVRKAMVSQQRAIARNGRLVMVGRDIGTVVLIDALLKIYLTASVEARAKRRYIELNHLGMAIELRSILTDLMERDKIDSERTTSPLRPAVDSVMLDTSQLTSSQVVDSITTLWQQKCY